MEYDITVQPGGTRFTCPSDEDLLTALHGAGINVESVCGGMGTCGKCRVRILEGKVTDPTLEEEDHLSEEQLDGGERLACQVFPESDLVIELPDSSLATGERLQLACELEVGGFDPAVRFHDLEVEIPASPGDHGSDLLRLRDALGSSHPGVRLEGADLEGLRTLPTLLREEGGNVRAVTRAGKLLGLLQRARNPLGLAVDLGSTKVALFLCDLAEGRVLASHGFLNPQIRHGEDIVTRIQYAMDRDAARLGQLVVEAINDNLDVISADAGLGREDIFEMVLVGNTAMHHLFLALPVTQLAMSPYLPATDLPLEVKARDLGLQLNPAAVVYLPPPIAGYVGSDHLAAVAAARLWERPEPCLLLDIGTNTEVALHAGGRMRTCSCASGPAFEGGGLSQGMRAGDGAIARVSVDPATGGLRLSVIGDATAKGICGSGILSALAAMVETGAVDTSGRMREDGPGVERRGEELLFYLAPPDSGNPEGVAITQNDVREIQKAKGAIRAGVDALLAEAGIGHGDLKEVVLAGAFGTFIDPADALAIALLPPVPTGLVNQVGNAAGAGARGMLFSAGARAEAEEVARRLEYLELSAYPGLSKLFAAGMYLSQETVRGAKGRFGLQAPPASGPD
ncbi:MAG: ASKHA domain-containing protein [Actinomycetota bacterium]|nr:ASKHA domain-containing protein [Actinomycetota bacterium]